MPVAAKASFVSPQDFNSIRLTRGSADLDPRVNAFRADLADIALADHVLAQRYAQPVPRQCVAPFAPLLSAPDASASAVSQLLFGETFLALEIGPQFAWGYCAHDHYVGFAPLNALGDLLDAATHWVCYPLILVFAEPSIKSPVRAELTLGARLQLTPLDQSPFLELAQGGFVHPRGVQPIGAWETDPVALAQRLIGTPYRWGGRGADGVDCSGLIQISLAACGMTAPRDSDMQRSLGTDVTSQPLQRGDLVCFPGHVGWMEDATLLLHANAFWMQTLIEPLTDVVGRLLDSVAEPIICVRRI
jgi:NlpC/P60 family/Bacterial dipeptidyl-peptidase Sh3 domain